MTLGAVITNLSGAPDGTGGVTLDWNTTTTLSTTYTTSSSFPQPDAAVTQIEVQALGAGCGGGGGLNVSFGQGFGGAGGAWVDALYSPTALSYPVAITIGAAGVGSVWNGSNIGTSGGDTLFGSYVTAGGGSRFAGTATVTGAISYVTENGGAGGESGGTPGTTNAGAGGGCTAGTGVPPQACPGGICADGPGGDGGNAPAAGNGLNATDYGAGGGGGTNNNNLSITGGGGNGSQGIMTLILTYGPAQSFNIYIDGTLSGNTTGTTYSLISAPAGTHTYTVVAVVDGSEVPSGEESIQIDNAGQPYYANGAFVTSPVFPPIMLANAKGIKPKIYMPLEATTIKG